MIKIEEARSRMTDEGVLATRAPYRVDVRDFVGGIEQKNQRGY